MNPAEYEKFTARVIQEVSGNPGIKPYHQKKYIGKKSGREISVDVSFEMEVLGFQVLFLCECKHWNKKIDVGPVETLALKVDDIGAHKGLLFSKVGFQKGAIQTAKGYGIGLARLSDDPECGDIIQITMSTSEKRRKPSAARERLRGAIFLHPWTDAQGWYWFDDNEDIFTLIWTLEGGIGAMLSENKATE